MKDMILEETGTVWLEDMEPGMARHLTKTIGDREIELFAEVSEDRNPIHLCDETAGASIFGQRIAHGMLSASLFSAIIGERLPGHGTIYLGQNLRFKAPVRIGDTVTAEVRVADIDRPKKRVTLHCTAWVGDKVVIEGDALVLAPSRG